MLLYLGETVSLFSPQTSDLIPEKGLSLPWSPSVDLIESRKLTNQLVYDSNFSIINNDIFRSHLDWAHLVVGEEGSGKTRTAIRDILKIDANFAKQSKDLPQVIFSLEQLKDFVEVWRTDSFYGRRGVGVLADEASRLLNAKNTLSKENKEITEILTQVRAEFGFFMVFNFQSFRQPESYIRNERVKSLARTSLVFDRVEFRHKTSVPKYYNRTLIKQIKKLPDGRIDWPKKPSFVFGLEDTAPVLYEAVNEKKYEFLVENEKFKQGKRLNERRKDKLLLDYQVAKLDGNEEKQKLIKSKLEAL